MAEAARTCSNQWSALIGSWVTLPMTGVIEIERGGDENITINHGCGGGDCGGGSYSALLSSCRASWFLHCLSPSSRCTTLASTHRPSLLSHRLFLSSRCAPRRPLILSLRRLVVASPLDAPPYHRLIVLPCRLSLSRRISWLSRHHLLSSSRCTALSSSHRAGWLLRCLSLRRPLILSS